MLMNPETLIACLTPLGRGAIATLGVRGPAAWTIARELFRRIGGPSQAASLPDVPTPGTFWLGWLDDGAQGVADQAVLIAKQMTPVVELELHCHGGVEVVRLIQEQFQSRGVHVVPWQEFQRGVEPAWQIAARDVLMHAATVRTAAIALDQWHGAFRRAVDGCCGTLKSGERDKTKLVLNRLHQLVGVGRHLTRPWRVVLAGPPNVGKSSLGNALAGFARSIVAPTPGTTRDVVTTSIALDGWPIEICDTAGIRNSSDRIERTGVERAQAAVATADLVLWLMDGASEPMLPQAGADQWLLVINKADLPPAWDWNRMPQALRVSALTRTGVPELCERMVEILSPAPPEPGEAVPHTELHFAALKRIVAGLQARQDHEVMEPLADLVT